MSSLFKMDENAQDLWDPSAEFLGWPVVEHRANTPMAMAWANDHALTFSGDSLDDHTVLFGLYTHAETHTEYEAELHSEDVLLVDSCANSSRSEEDDEDDDDAELQAVRFGDLEEQVHFFEMATTQPIPSPQVASKKEEKETNKMTMIEGDNFEDEEKEECSEKESPAGLFIKCEPVAIDSVVSTPDVVDEIITLEGDAMFRTRYSGDCPVKAEESIDMIEEFVEEYVDDAELGELLSFMAGKENNHPPSSTCTENGESRATSDTSNVNSEFEDDATDEDYKPPTVMTRQKSRGNNSSRSLAMKKRGRPAKPIRSALPARELVNLPPEKKRHVEQRFKNNEASRRSRFKRRQKNLKLSEQCELYESENVDLRRILKAHNRLHKKLRNLIINIKIAH